MALAAMGTGEMDRYLEVLRKDPVELDLLAKDLLINVTGFFRDPEVFTALEEKIIPDLVRDHPPGRPLRIWVPACSTGEEAYSLAMLFFEAIAALKRSVHVQVFASDVDPDAVAKAREGFYPDAVTESVSPQRLERFFVKDSGGFRVSADLRAAVVFTVQNVLADPPFSRLDMISCRNLLIYLTPEAQAKAISLFHFALLDNGLLLLGTSEEVNGGDLRFALLSKPLRLYRRVGQRRPGALPFPIGTKDGVYLPARPAKVATPSRQAAFAELCRQVVLNSYAPGAVLINRACECLYYLGSTDPYLRLVPGHPTQDLLSMAREGIRTKLRAAIHQASQDKKRVVVTGGRARRDGEPFSFSIAVHPLQSEGEDLLLVCFLDAATPSVTPAPSHPTRNVSRVTELERELETTRAELEGAIRNLELSSEEQKAVNEEALSVNEEFQSTNEELLASKEELQSLNEELTALNGQLQETLERQRTTSSDLPERALQHGRGDPVPRHRDEDPLLHAGHARALQRDPERCGPAALGPRLAGRRRDTDHGRQGRAVGSGGPGAGDRDPGRRLVSAPHPALPDAGRRRRRRGHHVRRCHRAAAGRRCAGNRQARCGIGQQRQVALPGRCQPRSAPAVAVAGPASGASGEGGIGGEGRAAGQAARRDHQCHVRHAERAAGHQPDRGRHHQGRGRDLPHQRSAGSDAGGADLSRARQTAEPERDPVQSFGGERPAPSGADAAQPHLQCAEIHAARPRSGGLPPAWAVAAH